MSDKENRDKDLWEIIRYYEKIIKINSTERIREVNRRAYFRVKSMAEFMCVDTSTWKDPE
jgi:hypothetical protein